MKKNFLLIITFLFVCYEYSAIPAVNGFIQNKGQVRPYEGDASVLFYAQHSGYEIYLLKDRISYVVREKDKSYRADVIFTLAGYDPEIRKYQQLSSGYGYIKQGKCIRTNAYGKVVYKNVQQGINVEFSLTENGLKYDIIVSEAGRTSDVKLRYEGFDGIERLNDQMMQLKTPLGDFVEVLPLVYANGKEGRRSIEGRYEVNGNEVVFELTGSSSKDASVVIDPWATFLGGSNIDESKSIVLDQQGNVYACGNTRSANFPVTAGVLQDSLNNNYDIFVSRFDSSGSLIWSTYFGGSADDYAEEILLDNQHQLVISGYTTSADLPVAQNGQDSLAGSYDGFVLKLDTSGTYNWSYYFGGTGGEFVLSSHITASDKIVIGGYTSSMSLPGTTGAFQSSLAGALDAFIAVLSPQGQLHWSTFFGGSNTEDVHGLTTDNSGNVIFCGETYSSNIPVSASAYQGYNAGQLDVFLAKFDSTGNRHWATYLGGSSDEDANTLKTDNAGNIYFAGYSNSNDFPITGSNPYQGTKSVGKDAVIGKFDPSGQPVWSTFFGGDGKDEATTACMPADSLLWISGHTKSTNLPMLGNSMQSAYAGAEDGFFAKLDTSGQPALSSYIGGSNNDYVFGSSCYNEAFVLSGLTYSSNFPVTANAFSSSYSGSGDAFVYFSDTLLPGMPVQSSQLHKAPSVVKVFPNPVRESLTVQLKENPGQGPLDLLIVNSEGKMVLYSRLNAGKKVYEFDIKSWEQGVYFLKLMNAFSAFSTASFVKVAD